MTDQIQSVVFHILRFTPGKDTRPQVATYPVPVRPGMTVLDGLHYIKENLDATLAWRYSCRMGVCGSCGMMIAGVPALACNTQILEVARDRLALAPLPNFDIVRDLVPDLSDMFEKHRELAPFIQRDGQGDGGQDAEGGAEAELNDPAGEFYQSPEELEAYLQFSFCIKCGCCMAACPTMATDTRYLGPMPLTQAFRYNSDTRDGAAGSRASAAASRHGVFRCHYAGECSRACPKGVDPAKAIQLLKRQLVAGYLGLAGRRPPCSKQEPARAERLPGIPDPPPYTATP